MKVLMITGDRNMLKAGTEAAGRLELQRSMCKRLEVMFWGHGSFWPKLPAGSFDVVTVQDPFWRGLFGWITAKRIGAKLHVQVHTNLDVQPLLKHILAQIILRHADGVRVVSEEIRQQVIKKGITAPILVLPIFVNLSRFRSVERIPHEGKNILWIGRFEAEKDPAAAMTVFKEVQKQIPDVKLIMLGKGSLEALLKQQVAGLTVEWAGWVDPVKYLEIADVVISTSKHESWGASIIEALAAGVPVVAPDVGIARDAGAIIAERDNLAEKVVEVLRSGQKGELKLDPPTAEEWAREWHADLQKCCNV